MFELALRAALLFALGEFTEKLNGDYRSKLGVLEPLAAASYRSGPSVGR